MMMKNDDESRVVIG